MLIKLPLIDQYQINPGYQHGTEMAGTVELFYLGKSDFGEKKGGNSFPTSPIFVILYPF